jgi:hypothetical protein
LAIKQGSSAILLPTLWTTNSCNLASVKIKFMVYNLGMAAKVKCLGDLLGDVLQPFINLSIIKAMIRHCCSPKRNKA